MKKLLKYDSDDYVEISEDLDFKFHFALRQLFNVIDKMSSSYQFDFDDIQDYFSKYYKALSVKFNINNYYEIV